MGRGEEGWEEVRAGPLGDGQVHPPLALPGPLGHGVEGRVQAVGVVADVAVVAQQQAAGVAGLAARLAHRALQTAPPLGQDDPRDLGQSRQSLHTLTLSVSPTMHRRNKGRNRRGMASPGRYPIRHWAHA